MFALSKNFLYIQCLTVYLTICRGKSPRPGLSLLKPFFEDSDEDFSSVLKDLQTLSSISKAAKKLVTSSSASTVTVETVLEKYSHLKSSIEEFIKYREAFHLKIKEKWPVKGPTFKEQDFLDLVNAFESKLETKLIKAKMLAKGRFIKSRRIRLGSSRDHLMRKYFNEVGLGVATLLNKKDKESKQGKRSKEKKLGKIREQHEHLQKGIIVTCPGYYEMKESTLSVCKLAFYLIHLQVIREFKERQFTKTENVLKRLHEFLTFLQSDNPTVDIKYYLELLRKSVNEIWPLDKERKKEA